MIDIDKCINEFILYSKKYDLTVKPIMNKFHHTFRVMEYCKDIARSEKLSSEDINLAMLCGLLHDIARYKEWTDYQTYIDSKAFDHGDMGYEILKMDNYISSFISDIYIQSIVLESVRNHNKLMIDNALTDSKTILMCKIVRDADKIDILKEQCNELEEIISVIKKPIVDSIYNHSLLNNSLIDTENEALLRSISFVFDFNFKYTYSLMKNEHVIDNKFNLLINYTDDKDTIFKLQQEVDSYMDSKINDCI